MARNPAPRVCAVNLHSIGNLWWATALLKKTAHIKINASGKHKHVLICTQIKTRYSGHWHIMHSMKWEDR